jgi:hypothetical protein
MLAINPKKRKVDEHRVSALYGHPPVEVRTYLQQLIAALYERVPYAEHAMDRYRALLVVWPLTDFEKRHWQTILRLALMLAENPTPTIAYSGTLVALSDGGLTQHDCCWDESMKRNFRIAKHIAQAKADEEFELPHFSEPRLEEFVESFGKPGLRRLAQSNRLSVGLSVCTDFWRFEAGDGRLRTFQHFLYQIERLVGIWHRQTGLEFNAGGPLSASLKDLRKLRIRDAVLREYWVELKGCYSNALNTELGELVDLDHFRPRSERDLDVADRCWRDVYQGVPALQEFVKSYSIVTKCGLLVEGQLWQLPKHWRLGPNLVESDEQQLGEEELAQLFCFGCDLLGRDPSNAELLRSWLALWLGALRPKESSPLNSELIPFARGLLYVVPRENGKTGSREAIFPASGLEELRVGIGHFPACRPDKDPTALADEACRRVRIAWNNTDLGATHNSVQRPPIPDRLAYFVRKSVADLIRWNAPDPITARVLGHEVIASDTAYTQISNDEEDRMYNFLRNSFEIDNGWGDRE